MARIVEVTVSPTGETTVQTKGYAGADCLRASKWLEQALGIAASDTRTPAFYRPAATTQGRRSPVRNSIPGRSVWRVRLPGARTLGCSGSSEKYEPRFW